MKRRLLLAYSATAALAPSLVSFSANAQTPYPTRAVRILIPFTAGQGSDILARVIATRLSSQWGQAVVVENKAGANGAIAAQEVARAAHDGNTLLLTSNSPIVINPSLYKNLPYNVTKDFRPVALLAKTPLALVANMQQPFKTVPELIAYAKANPGKLSYSSIGAGSTSHMAMEAFKQATNIDVAHIPYKGSAPALNDLIAGHVQIMLDGLPSCLPYIKGGRIRELAVTGNSESSFLRGVPTLDSLGVNGVPAGGWYGLLVQANTDETIVSKLHADFTALMMKQEFQERLRSLSLESSPATSSAEFGELIRRETSQWEGTAKKLGLFRTE